MITTVEKMYAEQVSKTDPIYSMLASQESLPVNAAGEASLPYGTRPLAELNSMATTVINTIGFVPRAIGSAVVDTFRSRSSRAASKEPSLGSSPSTLVPPPAAKPSLAEMYSRPPSRSPCTDSLSLFSAVELRVDSPRPKGCDIGSPRASFLRS